MISKALVVGAYQRKAEELARHPDVELMVVTPPSWKQEGATLQLTRSYVDGYRLEVEPIIFNGHFHMHCYPLLQRRFSSFRPDVVHIDEEAYNLATYQALRLTRAYGARAVFFTWQNIDRRYPWPFAAFERYTMRHADFCIAGNQEAADIQRGRGFTGGIQVIPQFGIDPNLFQPRDHDGSDRFTVGFAGRLVSQKGLWVLCDAFERLPEDSELLLVGSGPLEQQLRQRAQSKGWAARLTICSAPSTEMAPLYNRMDCLVLPSLTTPRWKEQFGRALIEAMACGVPTIGSDSGEIPHLLDGCGVVVPEGDPQAVAGAIRVLYEQPDRRRALSQAGRARVLEKYTQASVAQATYDVYREMLEPAA